MSASRNQRPAVQRSLLRRVGLWVTRLGLGLLLIVCITLIAVFSFEQYSLRPLAEFLVEKTTGRALSIEGELDARAGRIVSIRAGHISLANADWGSSDAMLRVDEAEVSLDLLRLFDAVPAADQLLVSGITLLFEQNVQGRSNWVLGSADDPPPPTTEGQGGIVLPIIHSQLSNINITVINPGLAQPLKVRLDSVEHSALHNELTASVTGAVGNRALNLQAHIAPLAQLLDSGAVDFDLKADFEAIQLEVNGHLDNPLDPRQVSLHVSLLSAEISQIFVAFGLPEIVRGKTELKASLLPVEDHHTLDLSASVDSLKLDAQARLRALDTIDGASITMSASGPDLAATGRLAGLDGLPSQSFRIESSLALAGQRLTIGETRFDTGESYLSAKGVMNQFPGLKDTNLNLQMVGKNYLVFARLLGITEPTDLQPEPFEISADLMYSTQDQQQFTGGLTLADVNGKFNGKLTEYPAFVGSQLEFKLDGQNNALIQQLLGRPTLIEGSYSLKGNLERTQSGLSIDSAALSFGANELEVSGTIGEDPLQSDTELALRFQGPDLEKIAAVAGYSGFVPAGASLIRVDLRAQNQAIHLDDLTARLGRNSLQASGVIHTQAAADGSRVKLSLAGKDIAEVLPPDLHALVDPQQPFALNSTLALDNGQLAISALQAKLGEVSLDASGKVSTTQPLTNMSLKLDASGPDLAAIIPEQLVPYSLPAAEFSVSGVVALTDSGLKLEGINALVGSDKLEVSGIIPLDTPTDGLKLVINASGSNLGGVIPIQLDQLEFAQLPYEVGSSIQLTDGVLSLQQLEFSTSQGRLSGELSLSLENPLQLGHFDLRAKGDNLAEFLPTLPDYRPSNVPFDLDARGNWDSKQVNIEKSHLKLDNSMIEVQGEVDLPPNAVASRLVLTARGDNLADLGQFRDFNLPADNFHIDASLRGDANGLEIPQLDASLGDSDLRGSISILFAAKPDIKIKLESEILDLSTLLTAEDSAEDTEAPSQPVASDGRVIPLVQVPTDQLNRVNLETQIKLGELRLPNQTLKKLEFNSKLQDGNLTVSQLSAAATEGQIIAQFQMVADGDRIVTSGRLEGKDMVLGKDEASSGEFSFPEQNLILEFETAGATSRELAANLNGYAQLTGGAGRLKNSLALGLFGSFFTELLSAVNPFVTKEPYTNISCFAAYTEIVNGVATINPGAVMQTDKLDMFTHGQIDLNTERTALRFDTSARSGIGISVADFINPFVGVSGTMASPGLGVDPENAMFAGGFAFATGGLSIVARSLHNRWFGASDPCTSLEQDAQEYLAEKQELKEQQMAEQQEATATDE